MTGAHAFNRRPLRAFISYRHNDAYMQPEAAGQIFIKKIEKALSGTGFKTVFLDVQIIGGGEDFENRIHAGISDCDLFVPLIGAKWKTILDEKQAKGEHDILLSEIEDALRLDKEILPILIDGATMPEEETLPEPIRPFHRKNARKIASSQSSASIAREFEPVAVRIAGIRKLGDAWRRGYSTCAIAVWLLSAGLTNAVGLWEFHGRPWLGMALAWSGLFIWPIFVFPFTLLALRRPLTVIIEATLNARSARDRVTYFAPVVLGILVAAIGFGMEISPPEAPWTVHPVLPACSGEMQAASGDLRDLSPYHKLVCYDRQNALHHFPQLADEFWLKDKSWPNVFFYLIRPIQLNVNDHVYLNERVDIQSYFLKIMDGNATI